MRTLPPLAAIRAFEAAARHQSFTRAAEELGTTQAAISHQIKLLEERLGVRLFLRQPRRVVLSEAGERLAPSVTTAFESLRAAFAAVRDSDAGVLSVSALHTFTANWLVPRLGGFQHAHPSIAVRLETTDRCTDFAREPIDVGIRSGEGRWPGLAAHRLMPLEYAPVCGPSLLRRSKPLRTPADLLDLPLLGPTDPWWRNWFAVAGVDEPHLERQTDIRLGSQSFEAMAAMAGQGVAIVTTAFFRDEIESGRLVRPFDIVCREEDKSYWLVYPTERARSRKVRVFRDWLLEEFARSTTSGARLSPAGAPGP